MPEVGVGVGEVGEGGETVQTSRYKINKFQTIMYRMVTIANNTLSCI